MSAVDDIWGDDSLGRRQEADQLIGYIESISSRNKWREDGHSQTIAVDAGYGEGKSFFLRRLARHLAINHPVAFVDAWTDDLADDPLTAIAATLDAAYASVPKSASKPKRQWEKAKGKIGSIAKIVLKGAATRAANLAITAGATEALVGVFKESESPTEEAAKDSAKTLGQDVLAGVDATFEKLTPNKLMKERIEGFRAAKDVPGLVFVFGMHTEQLAHSVCAAYGSSFDGRSYLRRFIGRQYRLATPPKDELVKQLLLQSGVTYARLDFPPVDGEPNTFSADAIIARYVQAHSVPPRDIFLLVDMLQTSAALTGQAKLLMPYLLPLIIGKIRDAGGAALPKTDVTNGGGRFTYHDRDGKFETIPFKELAERIRGVVSQSDVDISRQSRSDFVAHLVWQARGDGSNRLAHPRNYPELLEVVGRFSNPQLITQESAGEA